MPTCKTCQAPFPVWMVIDGVRRNLASREHCLVCVPRGSRFLANGQPKRDPERNRQRQKEWCQKKTAQLGRHPLTHKREIRKRWLLDLIGGVCQGCGYQRCQKNLAFHHLADKTTGTSGGFLQQNLAVVVAEVEKCVLLCHNCHGEVHDGMWDEERLTALNAVIREALAAYRDKTWEEIGTITLRSVCRFENPEK